MTKQELFCEPPAPDEWREFLVNDDHWKPGRSVWSVAHSWRDACGVPSEVVRLLGNDIDLIDMSPEYNVGFGDEGGIGGSVRCDVFARVKVDGLNCALVIEAKVDEPFGEKLSDWLRGEGGNQNSDPNRERRLEKICKVLRMGVPSNGSLRYQLFSQTFAAVHRAECLGADMAAMIVQSFCEDHSGYDDFQAFCRLFDVQPSIDGFSKVQLPGGPLLLLGWAHCPLPKG